MKALLNNLNTRMISAGNIGSGLVRLVIDDQMAARSITTLLIIALLIPIVFFGNAPKISARNASLVNQLPAPVAAPPAPFSSSDSLTDSLTTTTLSSLVTINQTLANGYQFVAGAFSTPTLPEGLAMAKMPTVWDKASTSFSSLLLSVTSFVAPLLFIAPNNASPNAEPIAPPPPPPGTNRFDFDGCQGGCIALAAVKRRLENQEQLERLVFHSGGYRGNSRRARRL